MLTGSLVAIITPMREDGSVHYEQFQRLIDWHIANGTDAIVAVGTTGESTTLSVPEKIEVIEAAIRFADGRIPIIAGTGVNSTSEAIELSRAAVGSGAYATLSVVPYYNKPPQEGIYRHFAAIAEAADIPMIVYNVPGRTVATPRRRPKSASAHQKQPMPNVANSLCRLPSPIKRCYHALRAATKVGKNAGPGLYEKHAFAN